MSFSFPHGSQEKMGHRYALSKIRGWEPAFPIRHRRIEFNPSFKRTRQQRRAATGAPIGGVSMMVPDFVCVALIAITLLFDHFVVWRAFLRRTAVDPGRARLALYRTLVAELWALGACVALLWLLLRRPWALLGLNAPTGWRLWTSLAVVSAFGLVLAGTIVRLARLMRQRRVKIPSHAAVRSPHTNPELRWWAAVSFSAGFCEELIFRGFIIWLLQPMVGWWGAAGLSLLAFAAAHADQGIKGVIAVGVVGAILTFVVLAFESLWPAIAIHALLDLQQGLAAWLVLNKSRDSRLPTTPELTPRT